MSDIFVGTQNAAHVAASGNSAGRCATRDGGTSAVWSGLVAVAAAHDAAHVAASLNRSAEGAVNGIAFSHGVVGRSNNAAYVGCSLDGCVAHAVFNGAYHAPANRADIRLVAIASDGDAFFNGAITHRGFECRRAACETVRGDVAAQQARLHHVCTAFQRHIVDDHGGTGKTHAFQIVDQAVALNALTVNVKVLDFSAPNVSDQRFFARWHGHGVSSAIDGAPEGVQILALFDVNRAVFSAPDRRPVLGQGDIGSHAEEGAFGDESRSY